MPRSLLAVSATALAVGAGGMFSGVLPLPPGMTASLVVAGDPASAKPVATIGSTRTPRPSGSSFRASGGTSTRDTARPSLSPSTGNPPASMSAGASASPSASATASASASAQPSDSASVTASASASVSVPVTTATGGATATMTAAEDTVLSLVNVQRVANGCAALSYSGPLTVLAQNFSAEMATLKFFDHTDPHGKTPWDRAKDLNITNLGGENIAMGQLTPEDVMAAWMKSPGHRANILDCSYHSLGVGVYYSSTGGPWWTQDFGF